MRAIRTYIRTLTSSSTDPRYYIDVIFARFSFSAKFYAISFVFVTLLNLFILYWHQLPTFINGVDKETASFISQLPELSRLRFDGGHIQFEQISLPFTITASSTLTDQGFPKSFIILTTTESPSADAFFTLTPSRIYTHLSRDTEGVEYTKALGTTPWSLTPNQLSGKQKEWITDLMESRGVFLLIASPFLYVWYALSSLLLLLFLSFFSSTLGWMMGIRLSLGKIIQVGLHAMVVAQFVDVIGQLIMPSADVSLIVPAYVGIIFLVFLSLRRLPKIEIRKT
jgi:hypothetical protein